MVTNALAALREENDELRERVCQLTEELASTRFVFPRELRLTASETVVFRHLLSRDVINRRSAMLLLHAGRPGDEPDEHLVDVHIMRIRRKVAALGIRIENIWGQGWRVLDRELVMARFK